MGIKQKKGRPQGPARIWLFEAVLIRNAQFQNHQSNGWPVWGQAGKVEIQVGRLALQVFGVEYRQA